MTTTSWRPRATTPLRHLDLDRGAVRREMGAYVLDDLVGAGEWGRSPAADLDGDPASRAASLGPLVPPGGAVVLLAAAWAHLGGVVPDVVDVALPRPVRLRPGPVRMRCVTYREDDLLVLGGISVTNPVTTTADLARACSPNDDVVPARQLPRAVAVSAITAMLAAGVSIDDVVEHITTQPRRAHGLGARAVLAQLAG